MAPREVDRIALVLHSPASQESVALRELRVGKGFFPCAALGKKQRAAASHPLGSSTYEGTQIASEDITAAIQLELKSRADSGAGLAELLAHLKTLNRRLGLGRKLTEQQLDQLSLYCWTLQQSNPTGLLWGRARELWGGSRGTSRPDSPGTRRAPARD